MPDLYVVATPIGNLEDVTFRAVRILKEVPLIAAEDTRKTRRLLAAYDIKTRLISYHEHSTKSKLDHLLEWLQDQDLALVSEAGMPGISDPGYELIAAAIGQGTTVVPIPGPSALIAALAASGLPAEQFTYTGFLPRKAGEREQLLKSVTSEPRTLVMYEAPHRLTATLKSLLDILGDRNITVARELTKIHEEFFRGTVRQALDHFREPRGEFTLVIQGSKSPTGAISLAEVEDRLRQLHREGVPAKKAVAEVTEASRFPKNQVYQAWLRVKETS